MALVKTLRGVRPIIGEGVFLAETCVVIGDVVIGDHSSIWYNVVIRGDVHAIRIGNHTNIQDGAVVHCTYQKAATHIGNHVTVGHSAIVHGCTLHDYVLIGMGAKVLDKAVIQSDVIIAAGALVLENTVTESGWLYAGVPARKVKLLSPEQIEGIRKYASAYDMYAEWYLAEAAQP